MSRCVNGNHISTIHILRTIPMHPVRLVQALQATQVLMRPDRFQMDLLARADKLALVEGMQLVLDNAMPASLFAFHEGDVPKSPNDRGCTFFRFAMPVCMYM